MNLSAIIVLLATFMTSTQALNRASEERIEATFAGSSHSNNWAVLISTSSFWFNYRHISNALSIYRSVKRLGIPDSQIILMISDDIACNPRNPHPGEVFNNEDGANNVYGSDIEVDYRGDDVSVVNVVRLLTNRLPEDTPRSKRLNTDDRSNVLVYMAGHGVDGIFKFHDGEEIASQQIAETFAQMWEKKRYNELLFVIETCEAASMFTYIYSPNIISFASSKNGEKSYAYQRDTSVGVYLSDYFAFYLFEFMGQVAVTGRETTVMSQLFDFCPIPKCPTASEASTKLFRRDPNQTLVTDFFGSVRRADLSADDSYYYFDVEPLEEAVADYEVPAYFTAADDSITDDVVDQLESEIRKVVMTKLGTFLSFIILFLFYSFVIEGLLADDLKKEDLL